MSKSLVYLCIAVFGFIGGYIPVLFGDSGFSLVSIITSGIGGLFGVWVAYKISNL
jgi:ABC-type antimicrobial peptide transport system permease subunit